MTFPRTNERSSVVPGYTIGYKIASGGFGTVHNCHLNNGSLCVIKRLWKKNATSCGEFEQEYNILCKLQHPNIICIIAHERDTSGKLCSIITDHGGVALIDLTERPSNYIEVVHSLRSAVAYMHSVHVYHLDLKLDNMTIDTFGTVRIIDFGLATCSPDTSMLTKRCGSRTYLPPELNCRGKYCGVLADTWSLGVSIFGFLFRFFPFKKTTADDWRFERVKVLQKQQQGSSTGTIRHIHSFYGKSCNDFFSAHPMIEKILDNLLCIETTMRISVSRSLVVPFEEEPLSNVSNAADPLVSGHRFRSPDSLSCT